MNHDPRVNQILTTYRDLINTTPTLLSLLYDTDLLPELIVSFRGALSMAAVCEAYKAGLEEGKSA